MGPTADGFYLLSDETDNFTISPGLLDDLPNGLLALAGDDTVTGSEGNDTVNGNQGVDVLSLGGGDDRVWGGKGFDIISGDEGNDIINGNLGTDSILGKAGNDTLRGGKDPDVIFGDTGDDWISGDLGDDQIIGGEGSDTFVVRTESSPDGAELDNLLDFTSNVDTIGLTGGLTEADLLLENSPTDLLAALTQGLSVVESPDTTLPPGVELPPNFEELLNGELPPIFEQVFTNEFFRQFYSTLFGVDPDPDGDGIVQGTGIISRTTGFGIAYVYNVTPEDLEGQFISLSDADLAVG